jgi:hypothetical protein
VCATRAVLHTLEDWRKKGRDLQALNLEEQPSPAIRGADDPGVQVPLWLGLAERQRGTVVRLAVKRQSQSRGDLARGAPWPV